MLLFFRLMAIDMTLFQFIDWFLEQFEEEEEEAQMEEEKRIMLAVDQVHECYNQYRLIRTNLFSRFFSR